MAFQHLRTHIGGHTWAARVRDGFGSRPITGGNACVYTNAIAVDHSGTKGLEQSAGRIVTNIRRYT